LVGSEQWERDTRFSTWNFRRLYREGSFTAAARELGTYAYKLDLVGVQQVRWDKGGAVRAGDYNLLCGRTLKRISKPQLKTI